MKKRKFYKGLFIYLGVLTFVGLIVLGILWNFLKNYQTSMPTSVMNDILKTMENSEDKSKFENYFSNYLNEFETGIQIKDLYLAVKDNKKLNYSNIDDESSNQKKSYYVKSKDKELIKVVLDCEKDGAGYGFDKWVVDDMEFEENVKIIAPSSCEVFVNDKKVKDKYLTTSQSKIPLLEDVYANQWVSDLPLLNEYNIEGFITYPKVVVKVGDVETVLTKNEEGTYEFPFSGTTEFSDENSGWIISLAEAYGKYITKDGTFTTLSQYLLKGSTLYNTIKNLDTVWFEKHESYNFSNQKVTDIRVFSENCFSCNVYFEQNIICGGRPSTYKTDLNLIFVKNNGKWYLVDMNINSTV